MFSVSVNDEDTLRVPSVSDFISELSFSNPRAVIVAWTGIYVVFLEFG
jgi:hypothetical protein